MKIEYDSKQILFKIFHIQTNVSILSEWRVSVLQVDLSHKKRFLRYYSSYFHTIWNFATKFSCFYLSWSIRYLRHFICIVLRIQISYVKYHFQFLDNSLVYIVAPRTFDLRMKAIWKFIFLRLCFVTIKKYLHKYNLLQEKIVCHWNYQLFWRLQESISRLILYNYLCFSRQTNTSLLM